MTSFNHYALGSVGAFLHSSVGGISPFKQGWKEVLFAPVPGGTVRWGKVRHLGPYGVVACEWEILEGRLRVRIEVPGNSRGVVRLPGDGEGERRVGSGVHEFEVEWREREWPPKPIYNPFAQYDDADKWET
jgi:alpha-L-rhamnosidase